MARGRRKGTNLAPQHSVETASRLSPAAPDLELSSPVDQNGGNEAVASMEEAATVAHAAHQDGEPSREQPRTCSSAQTASSSPSSRKRRLLLAAAEERACLKRRMIAEREQVELELINERLAADLGAATDRVEYDVLNPCASSPVGRQQEVAEQGSAEQPGLGSAVAQYATENEITDRAPRDATVSTVNNYTDRSDVLRLLAREIESARDVPSTSTGTGQLVNRLTSAKSLPKFTGDCLEWLRFKQSFELSSELGGYSERENVARLYEALKGEAREAVDALMITASSANVIMQTLQLRFGNPDKIINRIVQDIKKLPKINTGRMDLITFATKLRNSVAAMQTLKHVGYLYSPDLIKDVIAKMPSALVYGYNKELASYDTEVPRLVALSNFLYKEAERACAAGTVSISHPAGGSRLAVKSTRICTVTGGSQLDTARPKDSFVTRPRGTGGNRCAYCGRTGHSIVVCRDFTREPLIRRWRWVRSKQLCFKCLAAGHGCGRCACVGCSWRGCGRNHHRLLHGSRGGNQDDGLPNVGKDERSGYESSREVDRDDQA